jgi:hypothetical protein
MLLGLVKSPCIVIGVAGGVVLYNEPIIGMPPEMGDIGAMWATPWPRVGV